MTTLALMLSWTGMCFCQSGQTPAGNDIADAIPVTIGQTYSEILDSRVHPNWVFAVDVSRGIELTVTVETTMGYGLRLLPPDSKKIQDAIQLVTSGVTVTGRQSISYLAPATATYFVHLFQYGSGASATFRLVIAGKGVPLEQPPLAIKGCVTGQISTITYSSLNLPFERADELVIGSTRVCQDCDMKPPFVGAFDRKLADAYISGTLVEACFAERDGVLVRLKFFRQ